MPNSRLTFVLCAALVALALAGCGSDSGGGHVPDYSAALRDAPPPLAALYAQGDDLVDGGLTAFDRRLEGVHGYPAVVSLWASWCGPCRIEFPFFQRESARVGDRVAFLGVDVNDDDAAARTFLGEFPVPYPSYADPDKAIYRSVAPDAVGLPVTVFYDAGGKLAFVHQGQYTSQDALAADIRRYAG